MKKLFRWLGITVLIIIVLAVSIFFIFYPKIMASMDAKLMCSCVFVSGRTPESVKEKELAVFPGLSTAEFHIQYRDSAITAKIFGAEARAIFRKGVGCTLIAEKSEEEVRAQKINALRNPVVNQDTIDWPLGNKTYLTQLHGVDYNAVDHAITEAFREKDLNKPVHTHAVIALFDGQIIGERYADGFDYNTRQMGWSMTKSWVNALIGILVKDGKLKLDDPAPVPEWKDDERKAITLNDLLHASTGLQWEEGYFSPFSDFHKMFTLTDDKAHYAASLKLENPPGKVFEYSSGTTNILSRIVRNTVGDESYHRFPQERLFNKVGMNHALIEVDASGTFVGSSYGWASARDWARFGLLYLNDGVANGERILPEGWVKYSITPAPAAPLQEYGAQMWLNVGSKSNPDQCKYPGLPHDAYVFDGFEENSVVVVPSRKVVVVRLGITHGGNFNLAELVNGILKAVPNH